MLTLAPTTPATSFMPQTQMHIIYEHESVRDALIKLNDLRSDAILFVCNYNNKLLGTLTDGDLRRGFIKGLDFHTPLMQYVQPNPLFIYQDQLHLADTATLKKRHFLIIPIVDRTRTIIDVLNLRINYSLIPADVILMAGGRGQRLMPLTANTPKPMLPVGNKPILEHNIDRLIKFGIKNIHISVNYLANQIKDHFQNGQQKGVNIQYICENKPMGTIGSVKLTETLEHDYFLVMNSDILTNIDFAHFFQTFIQSGADMAMATTSYQVQIPYGIVEVDSANFVNSLKEKPKYTYHSNAGIYIAKKELLNLVPDNQFYNVTDLIESLIHTGKKLISYPITGYWLDIGKHTDYQKAQEDIKYINL
ncbi:MAG TPA: nucleotidyltransferase family protein [Flavipsychrobacter sp.]|nr:nucleotidyltransferase family protein [Flavipsychrobacter sp.]